MDSEQIKFFNEQGYLVIENFLSPEEIIFYDKVYSGFLKNEIGEIRFRSDLSGDTSNKRELITQIMVPSRTFPELLGKSLHAKSLKIAKGLLGQDIELDFDMLINKAPKTNTATPWHQDAAYWIDLPDKRAASCWVAIDNATKDSGCMWYTPGSHKGELLPHKQIGNKGALVCEGDETGSVCIEAKAGTAIFHHGYTLHYSRGNSTLNNRRAFITNFRPQSMITLERNLGVDHTGERKALLLPRDAGQID